MLRECQARLGADAHKPTPVATPQADAKPVVCFSCHEVGHKSRQCPKYSLKRIQIPVDCVKALGKNEVMADVSGTVIPVTVDSGAQMTVVPLEVVKDHEFTGETTTFNGTIDGEYTGQLADITLKMGSELFHRKAVAIPGHKIAWTAAMSVDMMDMEELKRVHHQI